MPTIRIALLDMYNNFPNEGMRCIRQLLQQAEAANHVRFEIDTFNVRVTAELPDFEYDIYISTGGPGSPLPSDEPWEPRYFDFIDALFAYNATAERKKHVLLICHSFQLVSRHLGLGEISKRKSTSFGVLPVHLTPAGHADPIFAQLPEPFYAVDSRDYQLTDLRPERLHELGVEVLCLEKERPHVPLARAIMALRFSPEILGTQFHPEADGEGMLRYMRTDERKQQVITAYGEEKYHEMVRLLATPEAIALTEATIVPSFLRQALATSSEPALA
ncbi:type 1 glutamine amidotransferase [Hymenobacter sp. BRD67]|uniref:type 1 glutamine amidotransferase n=1 Tax=Hymenobacter sp. BRD67 TaxID=2675877 RepID=UPI001563893B|nr:GMP synthase [Hymenobacter sp. BRD67]QKG52674.1 GMP synthase [Hymenobacter sp. BRD67]